MHQIMGLFAPGESGRRSGIREEYGTGLLQNLSYLIS